MPVPNDYALIIGVEDYSAYDHSMDLPAGTSAVAGAIHDAKTYFRQCLSMGFAPERIRVLTSPRLSPGDLGPEATEANVGDATHESMLAGITWLTQAIAGPQPAAGLLAFSGHGVHSHGVALCPSDATGSLEKLIHVAALRRELGRGKVADNLTMLLDCCHAEVGADHDAGLRAQLQARFAGQDPEEGNVSERVIAACARDQTSASSRFGGEHGGAFTWAITSAMGQWKVVEEDGVARLDVAYGELVARSRALLAALSFAQVPTLSGPPDVAELPFLHPGTTRTPGEVAPQPDAPRGHRQLDSGQKGFRSYHMKLVLPSGAHYTIARMIVTNTAGTFYYTASGTSGAQPKAMHTDTEYWFVDRAALANLPSYAPGSTLHVHEESSPTAGNGYDWDWTDVSASAPVAMGSCSYPQHAPASATWLNAGILWPAGSFDFGSSATGTPLFAVAINTISAGRGLAQLSAVTWYQTGSSPLAPNGVQLPAASSGSSPQTYCPPRQASNTAPSAF